MLPENQRYELTDAELERVSGGFIPINEDPDELSPCRTVYLIKCISCDWHGLALAENLIPSVCPKCGVMGKVVVHDTDTYTDDYDISLLSSWWLK